MMKRYILICLAAGLLFLQACNKETIELADCQRLKNGMLASDNAEVKAVIVKFLNSLPSQTYSQQNLNNLAKAINDQCDATASLLCFDCIDTNPPQSEIRISYNGTGASVERTIDLMPGPNNEITFRDLHY